MPTAKYSASCTPRIYIPYNRVANILRPKRSVPPSNFRVYLEFDRNFVAPVVDDGLDEIKD